MQHHPLRVPGGWIVARNHFFDVAPADVLNGDQLGFPFVEDILQLRNDQLRMTLDLGWHPDGDPNGSFRLRLIQWDAPPEHDEMPKQSIVTKRNGIEYTYALLPVLLGDAWSHPLVDISSTDQNEIVTQIDDTLAMVTQRQLNS